MTKQTYDPITITLPRPRRGFTWKGFSIQCEKCARQYGPHAPWVSVCDESRAEEVRLHEKLDKIVRKAQRATRNTTN